eukprot:5554749-Amphidinium_carterae.1
MVVANLPCISICSPPAAAEDTGMKFGAMLWLLHVSSNSARANVAIFAWNHITHLIQSSGERTGDPRFDAGTMRAAWLYSPLVYIHVQITCARAHPEPYFSLFFVMGRTVHTAPDAYTRGCPQRSTG